MSKRLRITIALTVAFLALFGVFLFVNANLRPVLEGLSGARVEAIAAKAMNNAILDVIAEGYTYESLIHVRATESKVYLLQADSARLNLLAADCANVAQERIAKMGEQGVSIPIGTILGIPLFAGKGPRVTMQFTPAGAVTSKFESEFRSAGINQTLHRINITLTATVRVILPGQAHTLHVHAEAPVAESIIVGEVPGAYTNVANEEDLLNLIPGD